MKHTTCVIEGCNEPVFGKSSRSKYCVNHREAAIKERDRKWHEEKRKPRSNKKPYSTYTDPTAPYVFKVCTNLDWLDGINAVLRQNGGAYYPRRVE